VEHDDRKFSISQALLMRYSLIHRQQSIVACSFGCFQQFAILLAFEPPH